MYENFTQVSSGTTVSGDLQQMVPGQLVPQVKLLQPQKLDVYIKLYTGIHTLTELTPSSLMIYIQRVNLKKKQKKKCKGVCSDPQIRGGIVQQDTEKHKSFKKRLINMT